MVTLEFCEKPMEERQKIVEEFYKLNISDRRSSKRKKLDDWCEQYLQNVLQRDGKTRITYTFEKVVKALPDELIAMKKHIDSLYDVKTIMGELYEATKQKNKRCYVKDTLYGKMKSDARRWLIDSLNVSVCPYCNRNYVFSKENVDTCDLDHYIPEGRYPIFAASFYNLIPSCPVCNRKKGEEEFLFYAHDVKSNINEKIRFTYYPIGEDYKINCNSIVIDLKASDGFENQISELGLDKIYQKHNDIVLNIIRKHDVFNKTYQENLFREFSDLFATEAEVEQMIFGSSMEIHDYGMHPLSKMTADIRKELEKE